MSWRDAMGVLKDAFPKGMKSEEIVWCGRNGWDYDEYMALKRVGVDPRDHETILAAVAEAIVSPRVMGAIRDAVEDIYDDGYQTGLHHMEHTLNYNEWALKIARAVRDTAIGAQPTAKEGQ